MVTRRNSEFQMSSKLFWSDRADSSKPYCVYLISYLGKDMPKFYIGKGSTLKLERGYHGTPGSREYTERWHETFDKSPEMFKRFIIQTYDTEEEAHEREEFLLRAVGAAKSPLHLNLRNGKWGHTGRRKPHTEEAKRKMRGKRSPLTQEQKLHLSKVMSGKKKTLEARTNMSLAQSRRPPRSDETKRSMSEAKKRMREEWDKLETIDPELFERLVSESPLGRRKRLPEQYR